MTKKDKTLFISTLSTTAAVIVATIIIAIILVIGEQGGSGKEEETTKKVADNGYEQETEHYTDEPATEEPTTEEWTEEEPVTEEQTTEEPTVDEDREPLVPQKEIEYNSVQKLDMAFANGDIDANSYFQQMLYVAFDIDKLDDKYQSDYEVVYSGGEVHLGDIYDAHKSEISDELKRYYLEKLLLADVHIGVAEENATDATTETNSDVTPLGGTSYNPQGNVIVPLDYEIVPVDEENPMPAEHNLDMVYLTPAKRFLIWYTDKGDDAITQEELDLIATEMDAVVSTYETVFGIEYTYDPYVDNEWFNSDHKQASKVMEKCGVSEDYLESAMSVYIFDSGNTGPLATYRDEEDGAKVLNDTLYFDILDEDGVINYPYIVINKKCIDGNMDSLTQVCNHEVFHHFQYIYSMATIGERPRTGMVISESIANYAAAISSHTSRKDTFLSDWATAYAQNTATNIADIPEYGGESQKGYALFPYFYSYAEFVPDAHKIIMEAHNYEDSLQYINDNTSTELLVQVINELAYRTISNDYDNLAFVSSKDVYCEVELETDFGKPYNMEADEGGISYFKLDGEMNVQVTTEEEEYVTFLLYGKQGDMWFELDKATCYMEIDTALYKRYDELYLAVTNGNLKDFYSFKINVSAEEYLESDEFVTSIDNYKMMVETYMSMAGIETTTYTDATVDQLHQKQYLETSVSTFGIDMLVSTMYVDLATGYTYMTEPYNDQWYRSHDASQMVDLDGLLDMLINMKNVEDLGNGHYKVKMTSEDMAGLMSGSEVDSSSITGDVYVDVYTDGGYITKLEYDFSDMISGIDAMRYTITFSDYNKAGDVSIPQVIVDSAIDK